MCESWCHASHNRDSGNGELSTEDQVVPDDEHFWFLKRELKQLAIIVFNLNKRSLHSEKFSLGEINSAVKHVLTHMKNEFLIPTEGSFNFACDKVCKCFKYMLIVFQFFLQLLIVPLLLVQWLDEYSWYCVIGFLKEDYCREMPLGYAFHQSIAIYCLYICVLLSIISTICMRSMPVTIRYQRKKPTLQSDSCLVCKLNRTLFLPNMSFITIIVLIYTSIMSQLTYLAIIETERDINSGRTFSFGNWHNRSISGGISNSVLWKCSEESNYLQFAIVFAIFPMILISTTVFYGAIKLIMAFVNYQKVKKLINYYYGRRHNSANNNNSVASITTFLHKLFQLRNLNLKKTESEIKLTLAECWNDANASSRNKSQRWCNMLFLIPAIELIFILLLCILVLTSYNVYPIGCFFHDVNYDDETSTVMLEFKEGVYTYQQVAVVMAIVVFISLFIIKAFHICHIQASDHLQQIYFYHHNQVSFHNIMQTCQKLYWPS